jgi:hypothetical protein
MILPPVDPFILLLYDGAEHSFRATGIFLVAIPVNFLQAGVYFF